MADDTDGGRAKVEKLLEVRPTVFVGLGGTGMEILLRVRRRILQQSWKGVRLASLSEFPVAKFLYFDTDTSEARESGRAADTDVMGPALQFAPDECLQEKVNVGYYQNNVRNLPVIAEWLPTADLSKIDTSKGAGQVRPISRLLFFVKYADFIKSFQEKAMRVLANVDEANSRALDRLGLDVSRDLRVVVVGSSAGGTGSGSFIDVGYALRSIQSPKAAQVDLFLLLPGGYTGANEQRVKANTVAALMELELTMRNQSDVPYVERWTDHDKNIAYETRLKPYSDVYLLDTANLKQQRTDHVTDLYDMTADILFEDFGSSDFARRKRSVAVNQEEKKAGSFFPKMPPEFGQRALAFSKSYSSVGQCTVATKGQIELDTAIAEASLGMVEAFFGVASSGPKNVPTTESRDEFLDKHLKLSVRAFEDYPEDISDKPPAIAEFDLVNFLLLQSNKASLQDALSEQIQKDFRDLTEGFAEIRDWVGQAEAIRDKRKEDVDGKPGSGDLYGVVGRKVVESKTNLLKAWKSDDDDSLKAVLYKLLDDHDRGGLDYTISLVEQVKARIDDPASGAIKRLTEASEEYGKLADYFLTQRFSASLSRLKDAVQTKMFGGGRKVATKIVDQMVDDLRMHLTLRLRSIACLEGCAVLKEVSSFLGERQGLDDKGRAKWSNVLGEFIRGYDTVSATLDFVRGDVERLRDARDRPQSGMYLVIDDRGGAEIRVARDDLLQWARDAFEAYKGSKALFSTLRSPLGKVEVLSQVQGIATRKLARFQSQVPTVSDALHGLSDTDRKNLFTKALTRALPWLDANFDNVRDQFRADQFKMFLAVQDAGKFELDFQEDISPVWPGVPISYVDSGAAGAGRIIAYCELSGLPLDVITPLRFDWRNFYQQEYSKRDGFPLHNHRSDVRFPSPVAPTPDEVRLLRADLNLFLRGVAFGVLRREQSPQPQRPYLFEIRPRDFERVGSELRIRRKLFDSTQRPKIEEKVNRFQENLVPIQLLAASALFEWTADHAYPKRRETKGSDEEIDERVAGLIHTVAAELSDDFERQYSSSSVQQVSPSQLADIKAALLASITEWTDQVRDSVKDVDPLEANLDPTDVPEYRAQDKRAIRLDRFTEDALRTYAGIQKPVPPPPLGNVIDVPASVSFYVAVNGETKGPFNGLELGAMVARGELVGTTMVYDAQQGGEWRAASSCSTLSGLIAGKRSMQPPPPPPPVSNSAE